MNPYKVFILCLLFILPTAKLFAQEEIYDNPIRIIDTLGGSAATKPNTKDTKKIKRTTPGRQKRSEKKD